MRSPAATGTVAERRTEGGAFAPVAQLRRSGRTAVPAAMRARRGWILFTGKGGDALTVLLST
jgi:hypothetical protein